MLIPNEVRRCVLFLGHKSRDTGQIRWGGTAFVVGEPIGVADQVFMFMVTARHCIEEIGKQSADGKVYVRINAKDGSSISASSDVNAWLSHPNPAVDVAVVSLIADWDQVECLSVATTSFCTQETFQTYEVGAGDEVFIPGLFRHHPGKRRATPIVRIGAIAAIPDEPITTTKYGEIDAILIESRSIGGLSGSPVFVTLDPEMQHPPKAVLVRVGPGRRTRSFRLLGLIHGHYDTQDIIDAETVVDAGGSSINMGIAIVIPASKILETLSRPEFVAMKDDARNRLIEQERAKAGTTEDFQSQ